MMVTVDRPWMLLLALACGLLGVLLLLAGHARRVRRLARYGTPEAIARLAPPEAGRRPIGRALRLGAAASLLGVALAGPRWGVSSSVLESEGIDIAIALDVSRSMLAEDERPSRLERMKQDVRRLRASAPGDRVALLAFAGRSYILVPLTADDGALELFLDNLEPGVVGQQGSALVPPLRQGMELLEASRGDADRALVVMSDGEAFDDRDAAVALAGEIADAGIHLVTVGFGTPGGSTIPLEGSAGGVRRDDEGNVIITRGDDAFLASVARAARGVFVASDATDKGNRIRRALGDLEAASREETLRANRPLRYQWFAALALLLLFVDALEGDGARRPRWMRRPTRRRADGDAPRRERRARARVGAAVLLLAVGLVAMPHALSAQRATFQQALEAQRAGRALEAVRGYRALVADGDRRGAVLYNLGTALLAADSLDAAIEMLERASFAGDADLRRNARYNLGLAYLNRGLRLDGEAQGGALQAARRAFRTVLLERPGDADAQWNYELALRVPPQQGGGGGAQPRDGTPPEPTPQRQMNRQQAEALLDAAAREERETQAKRRRGDAPSRSAGRDW